MFRLNISLTHVLAVLVLVGTAHLLMRDSCFVGGESLEEHLQEDAEVSLRRAAVIAEQSKQLDQSALVEKAKVFAEDTETYKYLTLQDRPDLYKFLKDKYSDPGKAGLGKKLGDKKKKRKKDGEFKLSPGDIRHLAVHEQLLAGKFRFVNNPPADWESQTKGQRNVDRNLLSRRPMLPDMVMAVDKNGVGVAALGQDRYSWFGQNVAKKHPEVVATIQDATSDPQLDVPRTEVWRWSWSKADDPSLYQVAIAPIRPSKQKKPAGAIVVGYSIDDGTAEKNQQLFAGLTGERKQEALEEDNPPRSVPQVAFFRGPNIHASTFSTDRESVLETALFDNSEALERETPEKLLRFKVDGNTHIAFVRFFPGQFDVESPAGFVILTDLSNIHTPVDSVLGSLNWVGGFVLILGLIALFVFYRRFMKPLETIDETISEILDGNKDATFVLAREHPIFSPLAENLNRMSAYLQGKPMPDDEVDEDWDWGEALDGDADPSSGDGGGGESGGSPDVHGVDMSLGSKSSDDDSTDSSDDPKA